MMAVAKRRRSPASRRNASSSAVATSGAAAPRIRGSAVPMLVPADGPVRVLIVGEAPGPRGADKSGVPFFGDAAGRMLYQVLVRLGAATLPAALESMPWDGAAFAAASLVPTLCGVALGNAFDQCPTDDGHKFRAPSRAELESPANTQRLQTDLLALHARGLRGVVTLGKVATRTMARVLDAMPELSVAQQSVPHPSAQGLLSMAPDRGKGARMADLQDAWMARCAEQIREAGDLPRAMTPETA